MATALAGQQAVEIVEAADDGPTTQGVYVSASISDMEAWDRRFVDQSPLDAKPVPVARVAFGTMARVIGESSASFRADDGTIERIPFNRVVLLDGALAGAKVYVSARRCKATDRKPEPLISPRAEPGFVSRETVLKQINGLATPSYVSSSPGELIGYLADGGMDLSKAVRMPPGVADVGYGMRAKILGESRMADTNTSTVKVGYVVEMLEGAAKGCRVVVYPTWVGERPPGSSPAATSRREEELKTTIAHRKARRAGRRAYSRKRDQEEADAREKAQAEYQAMLPLLLEQQRIQLEAMNQAQRNAALQRMAKAAEREAGAAEYRAGMPRTIKPDGTVGSQ
jgi:hypothetical protein